MICRLVPAAAAAVVDTISLTQRSNQFMSVVDGRVALRVVVPVNPRPTAADADASAADGGCRGAM